MDLTVNPTNQNTNFKAKLLLQGCYEKPRFWNNVAKEFEQLTAKKPNKYYLLEFDTFESDAQFSNMGRKFSACTFKYNFGSKDFYKLGAEKIAKMFVDITELLDKYTKLHEKRDALLLNKTYKDLTIKHSDKAVKSRNAEFTDIMHQMRDILDKPKNELIAQYVDELG